MIITVPYYLVPYTKNREKHEFDLREYYINMALNKGTTIRQLCGDDLRYELRRLVDAEMHRRDQDNKWY